MGEEEEEEAGARIEGRICLLDGMEREMDLPLKISLFRYTDIEVWALRLAFGMQGS